MSAVPQGPRKPRPVNLNLATIHFPVTAIVSILHRISGVILFFFIPLLLWGLRSSLASPDEFAALHSGMQSPVTKLMIWVFLVGLTYHMLAGIRHLVMDLGVAESLRGGRAGAWAVMGLALVLAIILGVWLW